MSLIGFGSLVQQQQGVLGGFSMNRLLIGLLLPELKRKIDGAAGAETGGGVVAQSEFGKGLIVERLWGGLGFGGGADLFFAASGNVNDGREIHLPALGGSSHGGDEGGDVRRVADWNGARVRFLDGGGQLVDDFLLMLPGFGERARGRLDLIHQGIHAEVKE